MHERAGGAEVKKMACAGVNGQVRERAVDGGKHSVQVLW